MSSWLTYLPIAFALVASLPDGGYRTETELATLDFVAYVAASIVGLMVGFLNVSRTDQEDKEEVIAHYREWQDSKHSTTTDGQ